MKYVVIENFFDNIYKLLPGFKQIKRYPNNQHPDLKNAKLDKFYWPGFRSVELSDSPFLSLLFLKTFNEKLYYFLPEPCYYTLYTHLRLKEHNENVHTDSPSDDFSMLVYLSETNLNSGTALYDKDKQKTDVIKCVQNRAVIFDSRYNHSAVGSYGTNVDDGRLTLNAFWRRKSR